MHTHADAHIIFQNIRYLCNEREIRGSEINFFFFLEIRIILYDIKRGKFLLKREMTIEIIPLAFAHVDINATFTTYRQEVQADDARPPLQN